MTRQPMPLLARLAAVFVPVLAGLALPGIAVAPGAERGSGVPTAAIPSECTAQDDPIERTICLGRLARQRDDLTVCDAARHPGVKYQCYYMYAQHVGAVSVCRDIPDRDLRDGCVSDLAALKADPGLCHGIAGQGIRDSCYLKVARATGDRQLCDNIRDRGLKSACTGVPVMVE